jgi:hypothetical protein
MSESYPNASTGYPANRHSAPEWTGDCEKTPSETTSTPATTRESVWPKPYSAPIMEEANRPRRSVAIVATAARWSAFKARGSIRARVQARGARGARSSLSQSGTLQIDLIGGDCLREQPVGARCLANLDIHRGLVGTSVTGALSHVQLARAQRLIGEDAAARTSYEDLLTLWKDAVRSVQRPRT